MSAMRVTEFDAALALLDLQGAHRDTNQNVDNNNKEAVETAKLFLSCLLASNVQTPPKKAAAIPAVPRIGTVNPLYVIPKGTAGTGHTQPEPTLKSTTVTPKRKSPDQELPRDLRVGAYHEEYTSKRSKIFKRKPVKHCPAFSPIPDKITHIASRIIANEPKEKARTNIIDKASSSTPKPNTPVKPKTREIGTQTEGLYELSVIESMEFTISKLCDKIKSLEAQIKSNSLMVHNIKKDLSDNDDEENDEDEDDDETYKPNSKDMTMDDSYEMDETLTDDDSDKETRPKNKAGPYRAGVKSTKVLSNHNLNTAADDMVPIGIGNAMIPGRIFRHINWNSYTSATRKLLTAVFSRKVLATHSLTGKASPAFPLKPPKKRLDAAKVNDIVQTVVERCRVPENVIRTSITTKCADESKMLRTRQLNKKKRKHKVNRENIPPDSESD